MAGAVLRYCVALSDFYAEVVSLKEYDSDLFKRTFRPWSVCYKPQAITTVDLRSLLNRLEQTGNAEENGTWMTLNSLDLLAKEGLIDLTLLVFRPPKEGFKNKECTGENSPERQKIFCNFTPTDEPYWATRYLWEVPPIPTISPIVVQTKVIAPNANRREKEVHWLFARQKQGAYERLKQECSDKIWYVDKLSPVSLMKLQDSYPINLSGFTPPEDGVVINDGTTPVPGSENWRERVVQAGGTLVD